MRFISDEKTCQDLFAINLQRDTNEERVFNKLDKFCDEKDISLNMMDTLL